MDNTIQPSADDAKLNKLLKFKPRAEFYLFHVYWRKDSATETMHKQKRKRYNVYWDEIRNCYIQLCLVSFVLFLKIEAEAYIYRIID